MSTMNIKPALQFRFFDTLKAIETFCAIMVIIMLGIFSIISFQAGQGSEVSGGFSAFGFAAAIMMFVLGIISIRDDLRLMLQNGVGRRTILTAEILVALAASMVLAIAGELFLVIGQTLTAYRGEFFIIDLYQILYADAANYNLSLGDHIESIVLAFGIYTFINFAGIFVSLLFYRLNKMWTLIVAIGVPLLLIFGLPLLLAGSLADSIIPVLEMMLNFALGSPWALILCLLPAALITGFINWLMIRRAPLG